jgi:hypothetical protein
MLKTKKNAKRTTGSDSNAMVESLERRDLFCATGQAPLPTQEVATSEPAVQIQDGTSNTLLLGERFRADGVVDAADYVVWRKTDGSK